MNKKIVGRYQLVQENEYYTAVFGLGYEGKFGWKSPLAIIDTLTTNYTDEVRLNDHLAELYPQLEMGGNLSVQYNHKGLKKIPVIYSDEQFLKSLAQRTLENSEINDDLALGAIIAYIKPYINQLVLNDDYMTRIFTQIIDMNQNGFYTNGAFIEYVNHHNSYKTNRDYIVKLHDLAQNQSVDIKESVISQFIKPINEVPQIKVVDCKISPKNQVKQLKLF